MAWQAGRQASKQSGPGPRHGRSDRRGTTGTALAELAGPGSSCRSVATLVHFLSPLPTHGADL